MQKLAQSRLMAVQYFYHAMLYEALLWSCFKSTIAKNLSCSKLLIVRGAGVSRPRAGQPETTDVGSLILVRSLEQILSAHQ